MIYPRFTAESFWNFSEACELVGARYPAIPLGLITVAALLPKSWNVRLVNRNTEELAESDLAWADMVMTGGMLFQQSDTLRIIDMCRERGLPVVVGGPDATSSPHRYETANFRVLGEVEGIIQDFIAAWDEGKREGMLVAPKFQVDVTKTPIPRFDLLKFDQYLYIGVQFSRGCPFTCEFCDIIELYGRSPRTKTHEQMLAELEALYQLGYRGHVDFVDDNLIGNKKAIKAFLPVLEVWVKEHDYPFEFTTEASLNLADDDELLEMLKRCNFFAVFVGIESPDTETLIAMRKKQNTRRSIARQRPQDLSRRHFRDRGLHRRLRQRERLDRRPDDRADRGVRPSRSPWWDCYMRCRIRSSRAVWRGKAACMSTPMPTGGHQRSVRRRRQIRNQTIATGNFARLRRSSTDLRARRVLRPSGAAGLACSIARPAEEMPEGDIRRQIEHHQNGAGDPVAACPRAATGSGGVHELHERQSRSVRGVVTLMAFYLHIGPYSRYAIKQIDRQIEALEQGPFRRPAIAAAGCARADAVSGSATSKFQRRKLPIDRPRPVHGGWSGYSSGISAND